MGRTSRKPQEVRTAKITKVEARTQFDSFYPMEVTSTADELKKYTAGQKEAFLLVPPKTGKYPIRMREDIPAKWLDIKQGAGFTGTAGPQRVLYVPNRSVGDRNGREADKLPGFRPEMWCGSAAGSGHHLLQHRRGGPLRKGFLQGGERGAGKSTGFVVRSGHPATGTAGKSTRATSR